NEAMTVTENIDSAQLSHSNLAIVSSQFDLAMRTESEGAKRLKTWAEANRGKKVDKTQAELGERFGLSQTNVSKILFEGGYGIETAGSGHPETAGAKRLKAWA